MLVLSLTLINGFPDKGQIIYAVMAKVTVIVLLADNCFPFLAEIKTMAVVMHGLNLRGWHTCAP